MKSTRHPLTQAMLLRMWEDASEDYNSALDAGDDEAAERHAYRESVIGELLDMMLDHGWQHATLAGHPGIHRIVVIERHRAGLRMPHGQIMMTPISQITDLHHTRRVA